MMLMEPGWIFGSSAATTIHYTHVRGEVLLIHTWHVQTFNTSLLILPHSLSLCVG
jgi:hypothetical protein